MPNALLHLCMTCTMWYGSVNQLKMTTSYISDYIHGYIYPAYYGHFVTSSFITMTNYLRLLFMKYRIGNNNCHRCMLAVGIWLLVSSNLFFDEAQVACCFVKITPRIVNSRNTSHLLYKYSRFVSLKNSHCYFNKLEYVSSMRLYNETATKLLQIPVKYCWIHIRFQIGKEITKQNNDLLKCKTFLMEIICVCFTFVIDKCNINTVLIYFKCMFYSPISVCIR